LTTLEDKKRIINSRQASVGAVAIIDSGYIVNRINYGHVAVVREVKPDGTIRIEESNWRGCGVGSRNGTPAQLKILGYFKP
jgi:surface antigen